MPNIFLETIKLTRFDRPIGSFLSFFPAAFATCLVSGDFLTCLKWLAIFFIGAVIARSAGCILNDLWDIEFDKHVERTRSRPLAAGRLTPYQALAALLVLLILALSLAASFLNWMAWLMVIVSIIPIALYPGMKRITHLPQLFLGITFSMGILVAYAQIKANFDFSTLLLFLACTAWTAAYDTIYGFMDIDDDVKIGVKSSAILFNRLTNPITPVVFLYTIFFLLLMIAAGYMQISNLALIESLIAINMFAVIQQLSMIDLKNLDACGNFFLSNKVTGFALIAIFLLRFA
jgi:4-hydroxybenzoate polyprenyltransferase